MQALDLLLLALVALWLTVAVLRGVRRKKRGCCGDCSACGGECNRK